MVNQNLKLSLKFYKSLYRIRRIEETIAEIYPTDKIKSPVHLSIGQEAVSVGVCEALKSDDIVFGTYRGHATYLAKGGNLKALIAELYGKDTGCAKGKGGSMHLIDIENGVMGTSAIVGTTIPVSVGYAYALKYKKSGSIVVSFFGDGAVDEGAFYESINFAALKKLPVLFICENNFYAIHSHHLQRHHTDNIAARVETFGIPSVRIEDGNIFSINESAVKYVNEIRDGNGPAFMECFTYRWNEHVGPGDDFNLGYRDEKEMEFWKKNDQLLKLKQSLSPGEVEKIEMETENEIKEAFVYAEESSYPSKNALFTDLFKEIG